MDESRCLISRTYWSATMERYLIELMIEQLNRGNRVGHTFTKQAWSDMLTLFNAKFGSQYDKDVFKNRYTNLWKQFNDVNNLLAHSGFSWDQSRQMVVATNDSLWNTYIKAHPHMRLYKTKPVLNFNDLCFLFSYTSADGRYSLSSHDVHFQDELALPNNGFCGFVHSSHQRLKTDWTPAMDHYFFQLLLDQIGRGNQIDNQFSKQAWMDMYALFNAKFRSQHSKRFLRNRYKKLSKYCSDVGLILKQDGFFWDGGQQMIVADDSVWDAYIKVHPHARSYRSKILPNYDDLILIFGGASTEGTDRPLPQDKDIEADMSGSKAVEEKGGQTHLASDCRRTYWTPVMDRHLIDLLLDQVDKGNKLDQTFLGQAWIDMVTLFNDKFNSRYGKDVLKNRFKHLRRLYNEMKFLLEQEGFWWDEAREMITADDDVWDAYIKVHPEARSYRLKALPSYYKLCIAFAEGGSDGRYNRLAQNADPIGEIPASLTGDENNNYLLLASMDHSRIDWTLELDRFFVDLMLNQVHKGNMVDNAFSEEAWAQMVELFNENFGVTFERGVLESRYVGLMKQYTDISNLLSYDGFLWDEANHMVIAEDDVWEAYIKVNPLATAYKDNVLVSYSLLCQVYGKENLEGRLHEPDVPIHSEYITEEMQIGCGELPSTSWNTQLSEQHRKRASAMAFDSGRFCKALKADTLMSMECVVEALQGIPDMDDDLLLDACDLLEDETKAKTFLALDVRLRKKWLLRKLRRKQ